MNRRNFFSTVGAAIAGVVMGSNVPEIRIEPHEALMVKPNTLWGMAVGDDLRTGGIRIGRLDTDDLFVRTFIADETRLGISPVDWDRLERDTLVLDGADVKFGVTPTATLHVNNDGTPDFDYYDAWL